MHRRLLVLEQRDQLGLGVLDDVEEVHIEWPSWSKPELVVFDADVVTALT